MSCHKREAEEDLTTEEGSMLMKARCCVTRFEDEGRKHPKECRWPLEARKVKDAVSSLESPEGIISAATLTLAQWNWFQNLWPLEL